MALVLKRKPGEQFRIGDEIIVKINGIDRGVVSLTIEAPRNVPVHREEVYKAIQRGEGKK